VDRRLRGGLQLVAGPARCWLCTGSTRRRRARANRPRLRASRPWPRRDGRGAVHRPGALVGGLEAWAERPACVVALPGRQGKTGELCGCAAGDTDLRPGQSPRPPRGDRPAGRRPASARRSSGPRPASRIIRNSCPIGLCGDRRRPRCSSDGRWGANSYQRFAAQTAVGR
jgi:hypothetical protein